MEYWVHSCSIWLKKIIWFDRDLSEYQLITYPGPTTESLNKCEQEKASADSSITILERVDGQKAKYNWV
jgi:hypothetical protein